MVAIEFIGVMPMMRLPLAASCAMQENVSLLHVLHSQNKQCDVPSLPSCSTTWEAQTEGTSSNAPLASGWL